jgi:Zn-dependent protease with chaperone function
MLIVLLTIPLAAAAILAVGSGPVTRWAPPATAVRLLVAASLVSALAGGFALAIAGFTVAAQDAEVAELGHWSVAALRATPIPPLAGVVAGLLVVPLFLAALATLVRAARQLWVADATCRDLGKGVDGLIVIRDDRPDAYALQGLRGRTVVSTGMLAALSPAQRRAMLAHEASHLANRHPLLVLLADVAAAANPMLRPTAAAVRAGVERWADEDAAAVVGDRRLVAQALARASLASSGHVGSRGRGYALAMTDASVAGRARALLAPTPKPRRVLAGLLLALTVATGASAIAVGQITDAHFDRAQASQPVAR